MAGTNYDRTAELLARPHDPELAQGALNAVRTCLQVKPGERCVILTDDATSSVAAALAEQFTEAGAELYIYRVEDFGPRPRLELPEPAAESMEGAQVSVFACTMHPGELELRKGMTAVVNRHRIRHAHMVGITERIMRDGMRSDFLRIDSLAHWLLDILVPAKEMTATAPGGTDLRASFSPKLKWLKTSGIITPDKWGNLPGGEVLTAPARVDGVYVCDGVLGDWLAPKYGDMREHPLTVEIENSRIRSVKCSRQDIVDDFLTYTSTDENSNRVGEWALGINLELTDLIGDILQDEKYPGLHIAFGHPYTEHTGADWRSTTHIDIVARNFDIFADGRQVMRNSRYLVDLDSL